MIGGKMEDHINKMNPTPLYFQLKEILRSKIETEEWKVGENIPVENDLMAKYDISRSTVRQAVLDLVSEGYLRREKSKGTVIISSTGNRHFIGSLTSFTSEMNTKGIPHFSKIVTQKVISADPNLAKKLRLQENSEVYYLKRIRFVNELPFIYDEHYIPYYLVPKIEEKYQENTSLYSLITDEYQFDLHHGQIIFEPINTPPNDVRDLLDIAYPANLILAERIVYSESNIPLDYFRAFVQGKFSIDVYSHPVSFGYA